MPLTGRFDFRRTLGGKIVLQVEEDAPVWWSWRGATRRRYRDANSMDLARPELGALLWFAWTRRGLDGTARSLTPRDGPLLGQIASVSAQAV
jgi:hypothetical protein